MKVKIKEKEKIYFVACLIMWVVGECLLIEKYDMNIVPDILLLALFGGGCVGSILFGRLLYDNWRQSKQKDEN